MSLKPSTAARTAEKKSSATRALDTAGYLPDSHMTGKHDEGEEEEEEEEKKRERRRKEEEEL